MSAKINIAALAAIITVLVAPAFAGDQDLATELQDSGRYFGTDYTDNPLHLPDAYASAVKFHHRRGSAGWGTSRSYDFQLQGR
jgi:hypothetical protein